MKTMLLSLLLCSFTASGRLHWTGRNWIPAYAPWLLSLKPWSKKPDKNIPPDVLHRAQGIILLDRTKAGFILAYQGGGGVAMVRDADRTKAWSPAAFVGASEASLGFQVGGEQGFYVILTAWIPMR